MKYIFPILFLAVLFANCGLEEEAVPFVDPAEQFATDEAAINAFLAAENLTADVTASGVRYVIEDPGRGVPITSTSTVNMLLEGYFLDGQTFDRTDECSPITLFVPDVIQGFREGIQQFNTWGKGKILIPSELAFGQSGSGVIPPNTVVGFDIEVVEQREFDNTKIKTYIAENNLERIDSTLSGIYYTITERGEGENPTSSSTVTVAYRGYYTDGRVFDQSELPISFSLNQVIPGWQEAVPLLKIGGTGTFMIPSNLAYGSAGNNSIPSNTMLIFDITLVGFN